MRILRPISAEVSLSSSYTTLNQHTQRWQVNYAKFCIYRQATVELDDKTVRKVKGKLTLKPINVGAFCGYDRGQFVIVFTSG